MTASARRRRPAPTLLVLGAMALVGLAVVVVRPDAPSTEELRLLETDEGNGCPARSLDTEEAFAFDGQVVDVAARPDGGGLVHLSVNEWFLGPPLRDVDAVVSAGDLRLLRADGRLQVGSRLLVRGSAWSGDGSPPQLACDGVTVWRAGPAADLRSRHASSPRAQADGPVALYPSVGFSRTGPLSSPVVRGVLLVDQGCVHVDDGTVRWLVRFPSEETSWDAASRTVDFGGRSLTTGTTVRLAGSPEVGIIPRRGQALAPAAAAEHPVLQGRPARCGGDAPVFVAALPPSVPSETPLEETSSVVDGVTATLTEAGAELLDTSASTRSGPFDGTSVEVEVLLRDGGGLGGRLEVRTDSANPRTWPAAYRDDELFVTRTAPEGCLDGRALRPRTVSLVQRAAGMTRLLAHAPGRPLVTVTVDGEVPEEDLCLLRRVADAADRS